MPLSPAHRCRMAVCAAWILAALLFVLLDNHGLLEPDEGRYAEVAREMAESGDWLIPHLNGFPRFEKPPLIYWFTVGAFRIFGYSEWAARLPSALAALGTLLAVFSIGRRLFGRETGVLAVLILASSLEFFALGRTLTPDMLMCFWITLSIAFLVRHAKAPGKGFFQWGFFIAMGLGFATKGPMALVVPCTAAIAWQIAARRAGAGFSLRWLGGIPLALAIGLAWFLAVALRHPVLWSYFAGEELVNRIASGKHGRSQPVWFFVPVLLAGMLPWTLFLPGWVSDAWKNRRAWRAAAPETWMLAAWIVIPFGVLSLSGSKLLTYVLPLLPGIALAAARWWGGCGENPGKYRPLWALQFFGVLVVALIGVYVLRFDPAMFTGKMFDWHEMAAVTAAFAIVGIAFLFRRRNQHRVPPFIALASTALWLALSSELNEINPVLRQQASVRGLAELLQQQPNYADARIFTAEVQAHGFEFYLGRTTLTTAKDVRVILEPDAALKARLFKSAKKCAVALLEGPPTYGLVRGKIFETIFKPLGWTEIGRSGDFILIANPSAKSRNESGRN